MQPWIRVIGLLLTLSLPVQAENSAESVIRSAAEDIYQAVHAAQCESDGMSLQELRHSVERLLLPHADLGSMSRWVMGKHWRQASEVQRKQFAAEFKILLVRTYATAVRSFSPRDISYLPSRAQTHKNRTIVRTFVRPAGAPALPIDYYMRRKGGRWLVYDIRLEGVSLIANYRTTFAAEISRYGTDGLIERLQQKNSQTSTDANVPPSFAEDCGALRTTVE